MEDLDPLVSRPEHEAGQLGDLAALGLDWDGPVVRQSERRDRYRAAIDQLSALGLVYRCYCTRREIAEASTAPNTATLPGAYPGTCRALSPEQQRRFESEGRPAALRLRAQRDRGSFVDAIAGEIEAPVDDLVLQRNDGIAAYNLAVVVDDADQGVTLVVRGDDLAPSTPRQIHLARLLGLAVPRYAHVALVLGPDGRRLAKRETLAQLGAMGVDPAGTRSLLGHSLGLCERHEPVTPATLLERFDPATVPRSPWRWTGGLTTPLA